MDRRRIAMRVLGAAVLAVLLLVAAGCGKSKGPKTADKFNKTCVTVTAIQGGGPGGSAICGQEAKQFCEDNAYRLNDTQKAQCAAVIDAEPVAASSSQTSCPDDKVAKYEGKDLVACVDKPADSSGGDSAQQPTTTSDNGGSGSGGSAGGGTSGGSTGGGTNGGSTGGGTTGGGSTGGGTTGGGSTGGEEHNYSPDQCTSGEVYDPQRQTCVPQ